MTRSTNRHFYSKYIHARILPCPARLSLVQTGLRVYVQGVEYHEEASVTDYCRSNELSSVVECVSVVDHAITQLRTRRIARSRLLDGRRQGSMKSILIALCATLAEISRDLSRRFSPPLIFLPFFCYRSPSHSSFLWHCGIITFHY
ncbi:hypothetical protein PUN28_010648 [Cardiocondyla obscurior]|uniref:Uncharacterized protein n=1 Tax=Cardiocondyla obscurior TaxID=286306 RepID=A0AAW2FGV6_9HYME